MVIGGQVHIERNIDTTAMHLQNFRSLVDPAHPPRIRRIKRAQNLAGIALARLHPR